LALELARATDPPMRLAALCEPKMAEVLCVYRGVEMRRVAAGRAAREPAVAVSMTRNRASRRSRRLSRPSPSVRHPSDDQPRSRVGQAEMAGAAIGRNAV